MNELPDAPRILGPAARGDGGGIAARRRERLASLRVWFRPFILLGAVALAILLFGQLFDGGRGLLASLRDPQPDIAAAVLGNVGQVIAQVLGVAISVAAIIVELAANRYTHRITELFFRAPTNSVIMGLFVVSAFQPIWVSFTFTHEHAPPVATAVSMGLMSLSLLLLLPYFAYVAAFVNPLNIINRIRSDTLATVEKGPRSEAPVDVELVQHDSADGAEQLSDVALNAMVNHDKGISMTAVNAVGDLLRDYLDVKKSLSPTWFVMGAEVRTNPDFVSLAEEALGEIEKDRTWFEFKLLRQYQTIYGASLNEYRELNYLISKNTRELAEGALERKDRAVVDLAVKFLNTFIRATINARDVRTAYNVLNQYRILAESSLRRGEGRIAVAVARYFKYYGQIAFHMDLGFILETAAYDLCSLNELAFDLKARERGELLRVFLQVDKEGEGAKKEAALRGVRKAQIKLATYYLQHGDMNAAREVYRDMQNEQASRLASIRDELLGVDSPYFWEVTDRGTNFDWLSPERKGRMMEFFEWFGDQLPAPRASVVPPPPSAPTTIVAVDDGGTSASGVVENGPTSTPSMTSEEASSIVSDPGSNRPAPVVVSLAPPVSASDRDRGRSG